MRSIPVTGAFGRTRWEPNDRKRDERAPKIRRACGRSVNMKCLIVAEHVMLNIFFTIRTGMRSIPVSVALRQRHRCPFGALNKQSLFETSLKSKILNPQGILTGTRVPVCWECLTRRDALAIKARVCDRTVVPQYTLLYNVYQGKGENFLELEKM